VVTEASSKSWGDAILSIEPVARVKTVQLFALTLQAPPLEVRQQGLRGQYLLASLPDLITTLEGLNHVIRGAEVGTQGAEMV
jgi:hypothetical protein